MNKKKPDMNQTKTDRKQHSQLLLASANADVAELNCSAETSAGLIASVLRQHTTLVHSSPAPLLSPVADRRLVLLLSDLHPPRPYTYATVEAVASAPQLLTSHGFYGANLEWTAAERVQLVATVALHSSSAESSDRASGKSGASSLKLGASPLATRFTRTHPCGCYSVSISCVAAHCIRAHAALCDGAAASRIALRTNTRRSHARSIYTHTADVHPCHSHTLRL